MVSSVPLQLRMLSALLLTLNAMATTPDPGQVDVLFADGSGSDSGGIHNHRNDTDETLLPIVMACAAGVAAVVFCASLPALIRHSLASCSRARRLTLYRRI